MRSMLILVAVLLVGCTSTDQSKVSGAVTTPLSDLNLVKAPIPESLAQAQRAPYALAADANCTNMSQEIRVLDGDLGPDLDAPASDSNPSLIERGGGAVIDKLQKSAEGVVPYRGWIRKLSGAERYSKQVAAAIAAGTVRRAFLKGASVSKGC